MEGQRPGRVKWHVLLFVGVAGMVGAITLMFHVMSAVMEIGGSCGSGGPYVVRVECPGGVGPSILLAIFGGIVTLLLTISATSRLDAPPVFFLGWPLLFGLLGANFLRFAFDPPDGSEVAWGWLVPGVIFELMAIGPLWLVISVLRDRARSRRQGTVTGGPGPASAWSRAGGRRSTAPGVPFPVLRPIFRSTIVPTTAVESVPVDDGDDPHLVDRLRQLAELHRRGDLTDAEFAAAKRAVLEGGG